MILLSWCPALQTLVTKQWRRSWKRKSSISVRPSSLQPPDCQRTLLSACSPVYLHHDRYFRGCQAGLHRASACDEDWVRWGQAVEEVVCHCLITEAGVGDGGYVGRAGIFKIYVAAISIEYPPCPLIPRIQARRRKRRWLVHCRMHLGYLNRNSLNILSAVKYYPRGALEILEK